MYHAYVHGEVTKDLQNIKGKLMVTVTTLDNFRHQSSPLAIFTSVTMKVFIVLAALLVAAVAQYAEPQYAPIPYSFSYTADTEDGGQSSRTESGDGAGRVEGSYTVNDLEGNTRVVEYIADEAGFRANIRTNEPGTASINPADVNIESTAGGSVSYGLGGGAPAPAVRNVAPAPQAGGRSRYVLVPVTDPRARGYY